MNRNLAACLALLVYGSWAAFVNAEHGAHMAWRAGLGQGLYDFASTWMVTAMAREALRRLGTSLGGVALSFVLSFAVMLCFPLLIHAVLGTIDVWEAIAPGLVVGQWLYCLCAVAGLSREPGVIACRAGSHRPVEDFFFVGACPAGD